MTFLSDKDLAPKLALLLSLFFHSKSSLEAYKLSQQLGPFSDLGTDEGKLLRFRYIIDLFIINNQIFEPDLIQALLSFSNQPQPINLLKSHPLQLKLNAYMHCTLSGPGGQVGDKNTANSVLFVL